MNKVAFLKILAAVLVFLLAFTYCIFPANALTAIKVVLDPSYIGGFVQNPNGLHVLTESDVIYRSGSSPYDLGNMGRLYFSVFDVSTSSFPRYTVSGNMQGDVYLKFALDTTASNLANEVVSVTFICGLMLPGYAENYDYTITSIDLEGSDELIESSAPSYITYTAHGMKFFRFNFDSFAVDNQAFIGQCFKEITVHIKYSGNPAQGFLQLAFWNENNIVVSGLTPDENGIVQGLEDLQGEVKKTNDLLEQPLSPGESALLDRQSDTNDRVKNVAESMVEALDQFEAPTDDISAVNNSISSAIDDNPEAVELLSIDFSDSSEFFNTITIIGVPGLGVCFLGYVLYGKRE